MPIHARTAAILIALSLAIAQPAYAFLEDICLPRPGSPPGAPIVWCVDPNCLNQPDPNTACSDQVFQFLTVTPGRSMVHMDATFFLAQALGYRSDVAYWIAAYNEVSDFGEYAPIDQCGVLASRGTGGTAPNSGSNFVAASFNGFKRTNQQTDGPLNHLVANFSPNGQGTDVHGAGGVQSLYPFYYPRPGYPNIDAVYQRTLADLRQWSMQPSTTAGVLCAGGMRNAQNTACLTGGNIVGEVPVLENPDQPTVALNVPLGNKVLNFDQTTDTVTYHTELGAWLADTSRTTGTLWKSTPAVAVPVQVARFGIYLHSLQDATSHATYCGDAAPSPPGGCDRGTFMFQTGNNVEVRYGNTCATGSHVAGHVQETATGTKALPLRDYVALNNTIDELVEFGNKVAKLQSGWIINSELLPPDVTGGRNGQGKNVGDLKAELVGTLTSGTPYSRAETYTSAILTNSLQVVDALARLQAMNKALADYSTLVKGRSQNPSVTSFEQMPGNSATPGDTSVCWQTVQTTKKPKRR